MEHATHTIEAEGKRFGRVAAQTARLLMGKHKPTFAPTMDCGDFVVIRNVRQLQWTGTKMEEKRYIRHTAYIGSLKERRLKDRWPQHADQVFMDAVMGMLPKNKWRKCHIQRLSFKSTS